MILYDSAIRFLFDAIFKFRKRIQSYSIISIFDAQIGKSIVGTGAGFLHHLAKESSAYLIIGLFTAEMIAALTPNYKLTCITTKNIGAAHNIEIMSMVLLQRS